MARERKPSFEERQELIPIYQYCDTPSGKAIDFLKKHAIKLFLSGQDALAVLSKDVPPYIAELACNRARIYLGNLRGKRRVYKPPITYKTREFTSENFRVTIDHSYNGNSGMVNISIYCLVEIWMQDDSENTEKEYLVNFSDFRTKEWLTRLMVWALMNKREVVIKPASSAEMSSMKMFTPKDRIEAA